MRAQGGPSGKEKGRGKEGQGENKPDLEPPGGVWVGNRRCGGEDLGRSWHNPSGK